MHTQIYKEASKLFCIPLFLIVTTIHHTEMPEVSSEERPSIIHSQNGIIDASLIGEYSKGNDHWKKILGLNLWYKAKPEEKISEIIEELENSMKHLQEPSDLCYSLLTIYKSIQQHPLENLLNATHFKEKNQEKRIYWMLYFTLKTLFLSAGSKDRDLTEISSVFKENKDVTRKLSKMMIEELEASGYWHWALFIWLLEPDPTQYLSEIGALIQRHIDQIIKEHSLEDFLISKLKIPHCLIDKAKGIFYLSERNYSQALKCFEEAEEWKAAHDVLCEHLAPSLVFSKEISVSSLTLLKMILTKLSTHKHLIPDWPFKGQILHRFFGLLMEKQSLPSANPLNQMCDIFREIKAIGILIEGSPSCPFLDEISKRLKKMSWKLQKVFYQNVEKAPAVSPIPIQCLQGSPSQEQEILEDRLQNKLEL